jgi:hypothetical protein
MSTANPFDDPRRGGVSSGSSRRHSRRPAPTAIHHNDAAAEPAIWAARHVEWPIPSSLSLANYQKLQKASRQAGTQMGISEEAAASPDNTNNNAALEEDAAKSASVHNANNDASYFSGFMSRVMNPTNPSEVGGDKEEGAVSPTSGGGGTSKPLRPPRSKCVATGNSWMVAALECPGDLHAPTLRLVSRWNVRRMSGVDSWMALPPPVAGGDGRIMHVFCDPTGCHTLISAKNGEAYYHHSSLRNVQKLAGFGRNADGSWPKELTGVTATSQPQSGTTKEKASSKDPVVQSGLSMGAYVTAVAWDRERGTEGSTKKILLGTNQGEIYEYSLVSPNNTTSTAADDQEDVYTRPIILHQLNSDAAVTGLAIESLRTHLPFAWSWPMKPMRL